MWYVYSLHNKLKTKELQKSKQIVKKNYYYRVKTRNIQNKDLNLHTLLLKLFRYIKIY